MSLSMEVAYSVWLILILRETLHVCLFHFLVTATEGNLQSFSLQTKSTNGNAKQRNWYLLCRSQKEAWVPMRKWEKVSKHSPLGMDVLAFFLSSAIVDCDFCFFAIPNGQNACFSYGAPIKKWDGVNPQIFFHCGRLITKSVCYRKPLSVQWRGGKVKEINIEWPSAGKLILLSH